MPTTARVDEPLDGVPDGPVTAADPRQDQGQEQAEARARLRRGRTVVGVVAAVLVVGLGVVALLGGFERRTDLLTPVAAGLVIATGPFEVTFDHATVEHLTSSEEWQVEASGTARTTGTTSIDPGTGDDGFLFARSTATREVQSSQRVSLGSADPLLGVENLTPGLPPVPWSVTFTFAQDPGPTLFLAVFGQVYTTPYIFGDEKGWQATRDASTLTLPIERLPEQRY